MKRDMEVVARQSQAASGRQQAQAPTNSSNPLKRTAEQWEQDDMPTMKLPRPNVQYLDAAGGRRASIDFATPDAVHRSAYSPAPSDSAPGSAYPRHGSPGRLPRALPSPSSLAFPPSGAGSFVPANATSIGSPGTSYHPGSSIHTVSTSSATSAHLQDLQHQVSLKSLALQTLQTEYATLLQKLQRERIKSQTIEKKTTVADQEVNELTTRNEELSEQIKTLEIQLQDCERKRDAEREDAAKEKAQWGRMLDMSGRLQSKSAADHQRIAREKADLLQRLATYESSGLQGGHRTDHSTHSGTPQPSLDISSETNISKTTTSTDLDALRIENRSLQAKVARLRSLLEGVRRQYSDVVEAIDKLVTRKGSLRKILEEMSSDHAQEDMDIRADSTSQYNTATSERRLSPPDARQSPFNASLASKSPARPLSTSSASAKARLERSKQIDPLSPENLAHIARAVSPGPAELGFHVQPSTSSPEELIRALGPVPTPLPPMRLPSLQYESAVPSQPPASVQRRQQSQPFVAPVSSPQDPDGTLPRVPSFRPLAYHESGPLFGNSPHSHHSSPGPNMSNSSSPSSTSARSPEYKGLISGGQEYARRHSQPYIATSASAAAMPPPPRPVP